MEYLCPLCNGLTEYKEVCKNCLCNMRDEGRIQNYYDDYSPYLAYGITDAMDGKPEGICQHLFTCPVCGNCQIINIEKIFN